MQQNDGTVFDAHRMVIPFKVKRELPIEPEKFSYISLHNTKAAQIPCLDYAVGQCCAKCYDRLHVEVMRWKKMFFDKSDAEFHFYLSL